MKMTLNVTSVPLLYPSERFYCCDGSHSLPIFSPVHYPFLRLHVMRNLTWPSWSSLGLLRVDAELCAIPPLGVSLLYSGCDTQDEGKEKFCTFLHRLWRAPFSPGLCPTPAHDTCIKQDNHLRPTSSIGAENSTLQLRLLWKFSCFQKQWMAISVTAVVLSGFHPHQSAVGFICSVPFLPPEPA